MYFLSISGRDVRQLFSTLEFPDLLKYKLRDFLLRLVCEISTLRKGE